MQKKKKWKKKKKGGKKKRKKVGHGENWTGNLWTVTLRDWSNGVVKGPGVASGNWEPVLKTEEAWHYKCNKMADGVILHLSRLLLREMQANTGWGFR